MENVQMRGTSRPGKRSTKALTESSSAKLPVVRSVGMSGKPILKAVEMPITTSPAAVSSAIGGNRSPRPSSRRMKRCATKVPATAAMPIEIANVRAMTKASPGAARLPDTLIITSHGGDADRDREREGDDQSFAG